MYGLSLGVFRNLVRRRGVRLLSARTPTQEASDDLDSFELEGVEFFSEPDNYRYHVSLAVKCINEEKTKGVIEWGNVDDKLMKEGIKSPTTKIFQACLRLGELSTGLSYYNHLLQTGQSLSVIDLLFFSKLLLKSKNEIRKYEPLLLKLYEDLREHLLNSSLIRKFAIDVFLEIPSCFDDIISILRNQQEKTGYSSVVGKALELNRPDVAFEFMSDYSFLPTELFLSQYVEFCINRAKEGGFSPDAITGLVNLFERQMLCFNSCNLIGNLKILVDELNKFNEYNWSVHECVVNENTQVCSRCQQALLPKPLTQEDLQKLKDHFFENSFVKNNIFLTSNVKELHNFLKFLENSEPFDIVMDVLNLIYRKKHLGVQVANRTFNYFLKENHSLLLVSRCHSRHVVQKAIDSIPSKLRHKIQTFFTSNVSEDDIFILQAALHGGLRTRFLTSDNCSNHMAHMDNSVKKIFLRWQMTHQYIINEKLMIEPPFTHSGVPQLTSCVANQKYIWHLSYQPEKVGRLSRICPVEWVCLKATKK